MAGENYIGSKISVSGVIDENKKNTDEKDTAYQFE